MSSEIKQTFSLISVGILSLTGIIYGMISCFNKEAGEGECIGTINQFGREGGFWKTYEGKIILDGLERENAANILSFSLDENRKNGENLEELAKQIRTTMQNGDRVKLTYKRTLARPYPWRGSNCYLITKIEKAPIRTQQLQSQSK